jgi:hypothetical protein
MIRNFFKQHGCQDPPRYIGDGVYASTDGFQIWLVTERADAGLHYIALEPSVVKQLVDYDKELRRPQHPATEEEAQRGLNDTWPGDPV